MKFILEINAYVLWVNSNRPQTDQMPIYIMFYLKKYKLEYSYLILVSNIFGGKIIY